MAETETRAQTRCDECKATDDHPKVHYGFETYHHDCLPPAVRHDIVSRDGSEQVQKVIQAAERGTHGDKLLAQIAKLHDDGGK